MQNSSKTSLEIHTDLSRDLGLTSALAIGVGTMIAAGIFKLSGLAVRNVGSAAVVAFLMAAVVATFTALTYSEFVSIYPDVGEGYLYARKTFSPPLAFLVGWALFLGYTSSCAFYLVSLSSFFNEFIWQLPLETLAGVVALLALTLLNIRGTKESGRFQVIVTIAKVLLLGWFVLGGMRHLNAATLLDKFSTDILQLGSTAALVFITFFGFSAIAASAGEVIDPIRTIPRAIFLSMGIVTVLYTLVVLVVVVAGLTDYSEASMGVAAVQFLGPIGGMVIVAGALFSMISASNASIMAGSRVTLSMSRLGHLPASTGLVHPRTRTPIVSLAVVGVMILIFAVTLPLEELAHYADTVLLLVLTLVNAALIIHRRRYPNLKRPFRVPLVPLLPGLGIAANLYLLSQALHNLFPVTLAAGSLLAGLLAFLLWKGSQAEEEMLPGTPSRVALERPAANKGRYRVLVPLANPGNVEQLIGMAAAVASKRQGEIIALRVVEVPEQLPPSRDDAHVERERHLLQQAQAAAQNHQIPVTSLVRIGHDAARAILETAREQDCDLIVLGWKGYTSTARKILGEVVDSVVNHARRNIMLVRLIGEKPLRKLLLPTAGGEHARRAEEYAAALSQQANGSVTVCSVVPPDADEEVMNEVRTRLEQAVARVEKFGGSKVDSQLIRHRSISVGIIQEARRYDAIIVGAAGSSIYPQILFGSIPESIAKHADRPVIMVKNHHPVKALLGRVMGE